MLVLSRKPKERVVFPNLGISVEILRVAGKAVRVGVEAPTDVRVVRGELLDDDELSVSIDASRQNRHHFRNRLNAANLALHVLQKQLDAERLQDAEETLRQALNIFSELDHLASEQSGSHQQSTTVRRALVVEDNANERELLAAYLRLCGYEVDTVEDGAAALDYLAGHAQPDVMLLDMQMPRMNGWETIAAIRSKPEYRSIRLCAVSGADQSAAPPMPLGDRGVDRWFSKPLNPTEFADQLDAELAGVGADLQ